MYARFKGALAATAVGIAGLAILAVWFGGHNWLLSKQAKVNAQQQPRVEMMPARSPEYLEKHFPGAGGKDARVEIQYRNGDKGVRLYREDGTLCEWNIEFQQGGTRLHVEFAADGAHLLSGYELRDDRSFQWRAASKDGVMETTTFYFDGTTVFCTLKQKIGDWQKDAFYFRKSGKPWYHKALVNEFFDKEGNRVYLHESGANGAETVTYFHPDGKPAFRQNWGKYSSYGYGEEYGGEYFPSSIVLQSVEEFASDGKTIARIIANSEDGSQVNLVTEFAPDGSKTIYTVGSNLEITQMESCDKDGKVSSTTKIESGAKKIEMKADRQTAIPSAPEPTDFWKSQEKDPAKRAMDAP